MGPSREASNMRNEATGLIVLEHSHLAIESIILNFGKAPSVRKTEFGALSTPRPDKADSSL